MKKILSILFFYLLLFNGSYGKILDVGKHKLEVPNKFYLVDWKKTDFTNELCIEVVSCYGIVDKKVLEIIEKLNSGISFDQIQVLKPILSKYQKVMLSNNNTDREFKSLIKVIKSTLNKNKSGTMFDYYIVQETSNYLFDYDFNIQEIKSMSRSELRRYNEELKNEMFGGKNYYSISDNLVLNFKKFIIDKNINDNPYLTINGDINFFIGTSKIKLGNLAIYISALDENLFILDGYCLVKCTNFFPDFDKIISLSFNKNNLNETISLSTNDDFINQLKQLNDLYKSGVLTKEEFEKAKKKILN